MPDLYCEAGSTLLITGDSGKGKTTYLHILAGLLKPKSGTIEIDKPKLFPYLKKQPINFVENTLEWFFKNRISLVR